MTIRFFGQPGYPAAQAELQFTGGMLDGYRLGGIVVQRERTTRPADVGRVVVSLPPLLFPPTPERGDLLKLQIAEQFAIWERG